MLTHPRMVILGSGSAGNATAITDGVTTVLVDCGFSAREISRRLAAVGISASSVNAILVTHEHGDHVRGIDVFVRRHAPECVVYASSGTRRAAGLSDAVTVTCGEPVRIGTLETVAFQTSHDALEPVGYRIERDGYAVGIATDTGVFTPQCAEGLAGCAVIALESNHDLEMLENGPYPYPLKRRIRSTHGHLSNHDAADALEKLVHDGLVHVVGMHRSRTNNTARLAGAALSGRLSHLGLGSVKVTVAGQDECCDTEPPQGALFG